MVHASNTVSNSNVFVGYSRASQFRFFRLLTLWSMTHHVKAGCRVPSWKQEFHGNVFSFIGYHCHNTAPSSSLYLYVGKFLRVFHEQGTILSRIQEYQCTFLDSSSLALALRAKTQRMGTDNSSTSWMPPDSSSRVWFFFLYSLSYPASDCG